MNQERVESLWGERGEREGKVSQRDNDWLWWLGQVVMSECGRSGHWPLVLHGSGLRLCPGQSLRLGRVAIANWLLYVYGTDYTTDSSSCARRRAIIGQADE